MNPLQVQITNLQNQVQQLMQTVQGLTEKVEGNSKGQNFEETIRNIVMFDQDTTTARTASTTVNSFGTVVTYPKLFDQYVKIYFRGKILLIPTYNQS